MASADADGLESEEDFQPVQWFLGFAHDTNNVIQFTTNRRVTCLYKENGELIAIAKSMQELIDENLMSEDYFMESYSRFITSQSALTSKKSTHKRPAAASTPNKRPIGDENLEIGNGSQKKKNRPAASNLNKSPVDGENLETVNESKKNKNTEARWTDPETVALLEGCLEYKKEIGPLKTFRTKKEMYNRISADIFQKVKTVRTGLQCESRYKTLQKRKRDVHSHNRKSGESLEEDDSFQDLMDKIAAQDDSITPEVRRGINVVEYAAGKTNRAMNVAVNESNGGVVVLKSGDEPSSVPSPMKRKPTTTKRIIEHLDDTKEARRLEKKERREERKERHEQRLKLKEEAEKSKESRHQEKLLVELKRNDLLETVLERAQG